MKTSISFFILNLCFSNWAMGNGVGLNIDRHLNHKSSPRIDETKQEMRENPRNRAMAGSFSQISSEEEKEEEAPRELKGQGNKVWR